MTLLVIAASTREGTADLLSLAYSTISVSDAAVALGLARHEDALQCEDLSAVPMNWLLI